MKLLGRWGQDVEVKLPSKSVAFLLLEAFSTIGVEYQNDEAAWTWPGVEPEKDPNSAAGEKKPRKTKQEPRDDDGGKCMWSMALRDRLLKANASPAKKANASAASSSVAGTT